MLSRLKNISSIALLSILLLSVPLSAQAIDLPRKNIQDETDILEYKNNLRNLTGFSPELKLKAAYFFRAKNNPAYIRPLGRELLRELSADSKFRSAPAFDPYVKSQIARTIGEIGQTEAIDYLLDALELTEDIIDYEIKKVRKKYEEEQKLMADGKALKTDEPRVKRILVEPDQPGPNLRTQKNAIPYSPDAYWSVADEFKGNISLSRDSVYQSIRLKGYNYVNLAQQILIALGDIYARKGMVHNAVKDDDEGALVFTEFIKHKLPALRAASAAAIAGLNTKVSLAAIEIQVRKEQDDVVKIKMCHAIMIRKKQDPACYDYLVLKLKSQQDHVRYEAALALKDLALGESIIALRHAHRLEERDFIKAILEDAIYNSLIDNLTPVSVN